MDIDFVGRFLGKIDWMHPEKISILFVLCIFLNCVLILRFEFAFKHCPLRSRSGLGK